MQDAEDVTEAGLRLASTSVPVTWLSGRPVEQPDLSSQCVSKRHRVPVFWSPQPKLWDWLPVCLVGWGALPESVTVAAERGASGLVKGQYKGLGMVANACNPSSSGGGGWSIASSD